MELLQQELTNYPDQSFVKHLCDSLRFGFDTLVSNVNIPTYECPNSLSARQNPDIVSNLLCEEVKKGFIRGPFSKPPFDSYRVSPLGIATHKYSGKNRLILDLSSPHNKSDQISVNDLIDKDLCSLSYVKIDDAIKIINL